MYTLRSTLSKALPLVILLILTLCSEPEMLRPEITSITPSEGPIGTVINIDGKNLAAVQTVLVGTATTYIASKFDNEITTVIPPGLSPGSLSITVKSDGGVSNPFAFKILASEPEITSIEPNKGSTGTIITIKGQNLATTTSITFGDQTITVFESKADGEVRIKVPPGIDPGAVDVSVTAEGGTSPTSTFTVVGKPIISSYSPVSGPYGQVVSISGAFFEETSKVYFDTAKATFSVKTAALIEATVPNTALTGKIKVVTPGGEAISETPFTIKAAPVISGFTPATGIVGTLVTINGAGFDGGSLVIKFGNGTATEFTLVNATQITAKVPATATTGKISLTTAAGAATSANDFTVVGTPTIASFIPLNGGTGSTVTITGTNFVNVSGVKINGVAVNASNYTVVSATQVTIVIPAGATSGKISITTTAGTATSLDNFTLVPAPTIASFTPIIGPSGTKVSITGTNFTSATKVYFLAVEAPFEIKSPTLIEATVPANAATGKLKVVTPGGEALSATDFTVKGAPEITSFTPSSGIVGTVVTITGKNFDAGSVAVKFGTGIATEITVVSATQITAKVPLVATTAKITVETAAGSVLSANIFTVVGAPSVNTFTPTSGLTGVEVTIAGANFVNVNDIKFNNTSVTAGNFTIVSATQIKAKVPAGAASGKILVTTPAGSGTSATNFIVISPPTLTSFTPTLGPVGKEVILTGTSFDGATKVYFGALEATFTVLSSTSIRTNVPVGAVTGKIKVTTPGGDASSAADFVVKPPPIITNFTPAQGIVGSTVTINGQNFDAGTATVRFGPTTATDITVVSAVQITAKVPSGATTGKITVETASGAILSAADFTVIGAPTISAFNPTSGGAGATITITGANFINVSDVKFNTTSVPSVDITVVSPTQLTAKVPAAASTGKVSVTTPAGTGSSSADFTVLLAPSISSFTPSNGAPGNTVTITGTGFTGTTAVRFNGVDVGGGNFNVNNTTSITATVPGSATTGKITVTNPQGTATSANNFYVKPFISSLSPTSGSVGNTVTINGTNLEGASVKFNATTATIISNTATVITVTVPSGVSGAVNVTVVNSGGTSNGTTFTISSTVVVSEIIATKNIVDQLLLFRGTGLQAATKVMFGSTEASVFTNTSKVVTTKIPTSLSPGTYAVTVVTSNGTSNALNFEVLNAQGGYSGQVDLVIGASVTNLPPGYTPPVSNQWINTFNTDQKFLLDQTAHTVTFTTGAFDIQATGTISYDDQNNLMTWDLAGVHYVGVWTPQTKFTDGFGDHCIAHMTLISAQSGRQLELTVEVGCPP